MLDALTNIAKKAINISPNKLMQEALNNTSIQQEVLDLNRIGQLYDEGIDSKGVSLGEYSPATIQGTSNFKGKIEKGQRYDHITLNDTGEFYESFRFKNEKDGFVIEADTLKDGMDLADSFGKEIIGLTNDSKKSLIGWLIEPIRSAIAQTLRK
jgi:hypothetical protein